MMDILSRPKKPLRFLLVRHGESYGNIDPSSRITTPNENIELTPRGIQQAVDCGKFLGQFLEANPVAGGISLHHSSYKRTRQTAQGVYDGTGHLPACTDMRVTETDLLAEHHPGYLDGIDFDEMKQLYPHEIQRFDLHWKEGSRQFAPFYGGELWSTVQARAALFLGTAFREHEKHGINTAIVVSHGGMMRQLIKLLAKLPREWSDVQGPVDNCDVRLLQRFGDNNECFGDFGSIFASGQPHEPVLQKCETAKARLQAGAYRP